MDKEEILQKSRQERNDEGLVAARGQGQKVGVGAFCVVFAVIVAFNFANGLSSYAPMAMFWAFLAAEAYPQYRFTKNKGYLVATVAGAIACVAFLGSLVITTLR